MAAGGTAAARVHDRLASLAVPEAAYALYVASRARPQDPSVQLAFVRPGPKSQADAQRIEQVFGDLAGAPLDTKAVQHRTARQYGLDRYESVDAGSALHDRVNSPQELFTLGGFLDISGLPPNALAGTQYGIARAIPYRRISRGGTGFFVFPAHLGFSLEAGNVWQRRDDLELDRLLTGGSLFLGAESPFGPVYLAAGLAEGGERAFYLYLGKTFWAAVRAARPLKCRAPLHRHPDHGHMSRPEPAPAAAADQAVRHSRPPAQERPVSQPGGRRLAERALVRDGERA